MRFLRALSSIFVVLLAGHSWATTYYIDSVAGDDSRDGLSDTTSWKTISKVNGFAFAPGDDVYFKCGSTFIGERLIIDWSGSSANRVIIGAYYDSGSIGVSGSKPIIDGQQSYPDQYSSLISVSAQDYITITHLDVRNSGGRFISFDNANYGIVDGVDCSWSFKKGISISNGSDNCQVINSTITGNGQAFAQDSGATWGSALLCFNSANCVFRFNTIHENYGEGLNFRSGATGGLAEKNLIYGNRAVQLYIDGGADNTIRYNLIYGTTDAVFQRYPGYSGNGIYVTDEQSDGDHDSTGNRIFGNFIANTYRGVHLAANADMTGQLIYNNTIIDCGVDVEIDTNQYSNCEVKNNIFSSSAGASGLYDGPSTTTGITWDYNLWSAAVSGDPAGLNDAIAPPLTAKTAGWGSITAGSLAAADFAIQQGSPAINAGAVLASPYDSLLDAQKANFQSFFFAIYSQGLSPEIGADIYLLQQASGSLLPVFNLGGGKNILNSDTSATIAPVLIFLK